MNKKTIAILSAFTAINLAGLAAYSFATANDSGTSGTITVGNQSPVTMLSVTIGTTPCPLSNSNQTFTCPNNALPGPGQAEPLTVQLKNYATVTESIPTATWTFTSTGTSTSSILSVSGSCPNQLTSGTSNYCNFTVQALTTGSDSFTLTI